MKKVLSILLMLGGGGLIGYLIGGLLKGDGGGESAIPKEHGIWMFLSLLVWYFIVVGVHELGHVFAGRWQNFDFHGLTIGPFSWKPDAAGKIRFKWNTSLNLAGGLAIMLPNGDERLRQRFMWFGAGGPIASVLLALLLYGFYLLAPDRSLGAGLLFVGALLSAAIFVATILPFRAGGFSSDGLRILTFARNGPTALADLTGLRALSHLRTGKPYAELPLADIAAVAENPTVPKQQRVTMDYYRYLHAAAAGQTSEASALLGSVIDRIDAFPAGTHGGFYLEEAFFRAHHQRDLPAAEAALAKFEPGPMVEPLGIHLANAAIADLKGDYSALAVELPGIEKGLPRTVDQSAVPQIRQWVKDWSAKTATA